MKKKLRKLCSLFLVALIIATVFAACGRSGTEGNYVEDASVKDTTGSTPDSWSGIYTNESGTLTMTSSSDMADRIYYMLVSQANSAISSGTLMLDEENATVLQDSFHTFYLQ